MLLEYVGGHLFQAWELGKGSLSLRHVSLHGIHGHVFANELVHLCVHLVVGGAGARTRALQVDRRVFSATESLMSQLERGIQTQMSLERYRDYIMPGFIRLLKVLTLPLEQ